MAENETPHSQVIHQQPQMRGDVFDVFQVIDRGGLTVKMEDHIAEAAEVASRSGKKSKVIITLTFDPDEKTESIRVSGNSKTVLPAEPEKAAIFFIGPDGKLTRNDTRSPRMFAPPDES